MRWSHEGYELSDHHGDVDIDFVHALLENTYWAKGRSRELVAASLEGSIPFSLTQGGRPVGFARVVTDRVTFAWIADVIIHPDHRGRGLGKWMMTCVLEHPAVAPTLQQVLRTRDAQGLYEGFGFETATCMTRRR